MAGVSGIPILWTSLKSGTQALELVVYLVCRCTAFDSVAGVVLGGLEMAGDGVMRGVFIGGAAGNPLRSSPKPQTHYFDESPPL